MNLNDIDAVLIAGPTASGKSARATQLALERHGVVINADSMQVYADLPILSARPTPEQEAGVPHLLFGHVGAERNYSVAQWLDDAERALAQARQMGRLPIFVGGTGMYFKALIRGLSDIPAVPEEVRAQVRLESEGAYPGEMYQRLKALDPLTAARLRPTDPQRILRALEVFAATGVSLTAFQGSRAPALLNAEHCQCLFLAPDRPELMRRIESRFDAMLEAGALAEVERLAARELAPDLPALRAVGVPGLLAYLKGETTFEAAVERGKRDSRRYAKRQYTFARTQLPEFAWIDPQGCIDPQVRETRVRPKVRETFS